MTGLSVIILVGREERHIRRCLERLAPLEPWQVIVVESQKGDRTHEIAIETAKCLNWRVEKCLDGEGKKVGRESRSTADGSSHSNIQTFSPSNITIDRRAMAEKKVEEWLEGVDEATFEEKKPPRLVPLTEAVRTVVHYQTTAGSYPPNESSIAFSQDENKGVWKDLGVDDRCTAVGKCLNGGIKECLNEKGVGERCSADESDSSIQTFKHSNIQTFLTTVWHDWPGTQAAQFDWSLDYVEGRSKKEEGRSEEEEGRSGGEWILRLDADEYLSEELIAEIKEKLPEVSASVYGIRLRLERIWQGREIRHATNGIMQVRMFRRGKGRYLETLMDERLVTGDWKRVDGGWQLKQSDDSNNPTIDFKGAFYDASLLPLDEWKSKQLGYAKREALQAMSGTSQDWRKRIYYLPIFAPIRPLAYFCFRYFLKLGFLDGRAGWSWNYWQALWYRTQVECEIRKLKNLNH